MRRSFLLILLFMGGLFYIWQTVSCNRIGGIVKTNYTLPVPKLKEVKPYTVPGPAEPRKKNTDSVYICNSQTAYAYHQGYCTGLKRCKAGVIKMPKSEAESKGRNKACGFCYGKN